jgi:hypothetical protein
MIRSNAKFTSHCAARAFHPLKLVQRITNGLGTSLLKAIQTLLVSR